MLVQRMALFGGNLPKPSFASVAWGTVFVPNDGGGEFNITFSLSNAAGGEYVDVTWQIAGTSPVGETTSGHFTSSPITIIPGNGTYPGGGLWSGDVINATCRLYTGTGVLVDTYVLAAYNC
jgi:hypothetical protein